ncbi:DNA-binding response regulator, LytR/AlgR family [Pseudobutyrivibrio sp. 49]|uniref:LytR/AlgR family response regulator transcription factor n=1 Tax=Pseudobutyrivibrio sp. 49 TaxID=1855344 RepID=UPI0008820C41|nr:LytTR family DNA-binding domain-containing protein [Pseudobutyrivibrio sp. 49]SDH27400.1 DNA-binding response regulator, LytR/AlgR family [Pseudobutyrivibrio sp. 49]
MTERSNYEIAIIDDNPEDSLLLKTHLERYFEKNEMHYSIASFGSGVEFLEEKREYDIVFLDIEIPGMNGIETAAELRKRQTDAVIVLVTNMLQYAIQGYSVRAIDYILKPVTYEHINSKMPFFIESISKKKKKIIIKTRDSVSNLLIAKIDYIEVFGHRINVHYEDQCIECTGTLKDYESQLSGAGFVKSSKSCLVNLANVERIDVDTLTVNGKTVPLSRRERKAFIEAFTVYDGR